MVRLRAGTLLLLGSLLAAALAATPGPANAHAPSPAWNLDRDGDRLDDTLARALEDPATPRGPTRTGPDGRTLFGVFVVFERPLDDEDVDVLRAAGLRDVERFELLPDRAHGWADGRALRALAAVAGVARVEADVELRPMLGVSARAVRARPSDLYPEAAWTTFGVTGDGVALAILDTGVDDEHALLAGKYQAGFDATLPPTFAENAALRPLLYETNPDDDDFLPGVGAQHGTHVAGIALGGTADGPVAGVAPGARLVDVKVLGPTGGTTLEVVRGLDWLVRYNAGQTSYGPPPLPVRVASLSLGGYPTNGSPPDGTDSASAAVNEAFEQGILVVVAAGNCGPASTAPAAECPRKGADSVALPAVAARALAVGAVDDAGSVGRSDDTVAGYSSRGPNGAEPKPNLAAPGTNIESAAGAALPGAAGTGTRVHSGTSMAAPHVAGAAALLFSAHPGLTAEQARGLLLATAEDRGEPGWDPSYGAGLLDAYGPTGHALRLAGDDRADADPELPPLPDLPGGDDNVSVGPASDNQPPVAKFRFAPARGVVGKPVTFTDESTDADGRVTERHWSFGDGSTAAGATVQHLYGRPGTFTVTLRAVDDGGAAKTATSSLVVVEAEPLGPTAKGAPGAGAALLVAAAAVALAVVRRPRAG